MAAAAPGGQPAPPEPIPSGGGGASDAEPEPVVGRWLADPDHVPWMPEWADPEWRENIEYSARGNSFREHFVSSGGPLLRPAILPRDQINNPTEYARRFGIYPKDRPDDPDPIFGRSNITPTTPGPGQLPPDPSGTEEVWQSVVFGGPTTRELIDSGAYDPNYQSSGTPISGDLHYLFSRDKWLNATVASRIFPSAICNTRWRFGDEEGQYDVDDDRVWAAMEPALRLASRVIASNHPFWNAMLSLYNVRPVPDDVDGRNAEARQRDGAPFMSLWLDENRPGMYEFASQLKQLGFRSRETTQAILNQYLRFTIGTWEPTARASGVTFGLGLIREPRKPFPPRPRIMIIKFPEARAVAAFDLARIILHEMAHACKSEFTPDPDFTLNNLPEATVRDLGITPEMRLRFVPLYHAMYGGQNARPGQYFFQEGPQMEEGKAFENELWGGIIHSGNPVANENETKMSCMIQCLSWPQSHLAPDLQHTEVDKSFYGPYSATPYAGYLLNPPAPVYDQRRPVAVNEYAQFFSEEWWQDLFQRFGHHAFKLQAHSNSLLLVHSRGIRILAFELRRELGDEDFNYITGVAAPLLNDSNQFILSSWLRAEMEDLVFYQTTMRRLFYEARTWQNTYGRLNSLAQKSTTDIDQMAAAIAGWVADSAAGRLQTPDSQETVRRAFSQASDTVMAADLLEFDRLLGYAIQYSQSLIAIYSLLPTEFERRTVHQRYMTPIRGHLNLVRTWLLALGRKLQAFATYLSSIDGQFLLNENIQAIVYYINLMQESANGRDANLQHTIELLADENIAPGFDYSRHPNTLPSVPESRKRLTMRALWTKASARPLTYLSASSRSRVVEVVQRCSEILLNHRTERDRRRQTGNQNFPALHSGAGAGGPSGAGGSSGNAPPQSPGPTSDVDLNAPQEFDIPWEIAEGM
ncbi:hypothetical protein KVR01_000733 [Diaporthe batatas]|uniref:uncharacterized protein n=1 Tax=Diaporthe batatas TaxID=748121 RepID=UPI001D045D5B|nr:uncharacterized protein KVR01_000733 [Diaporthe batatas]KAG8169988.1 hypothetical protein KVR01_000733 [Diaporthe batatas]